MNDVGGGGGDDRASRCSKRLPRGVKVARTSPRRIAGVGFEEGTEGKADQVAIYSQANLYMYTETIVIPSIVIVLARGFKPPTVIIIAYVIHENTHTTSAKGGNLSQQDYSGQWSLAFRSMQQGCRYCVHLLATAQHD